MPDVEMSDVPVAPEVPNPSRPVQSIETEQLAREEDNPNDESDGDANEMQDVGGIERPVSNDQYRALKAITDTLTNCTVKKGSEDYYPSTLFKRIPNKRNLPDYYTVIKEPTAISTMKGKIQRKTYSGIPEFVRDFALIVHNAQVYNRPNSSPVRDVLQLEAVFKQEMQKLVEEALVKADETKFPDLGPIPDATPEPDPVSADEEDDEAEEDGEDEDDEEDADDSDDNRRKRRGRRGTRTSISERKVDGDDDEDGKGTEADGRKRRGRPPKVDTPMEARIKAVIKGLRKPKDERGNLRIVHFERLPDKMEYPHYYQEIKEPIALDTIKKKSKRKKYTSIDQFMRDVEVMFKNAMTYNEDSSIIYRDADALLAEARGLVEVEKKKPDAEYLLEDGRLPLPEGILYKGEIWKVGDWIHIENPNNVTKPIIAQIYRTWQDAEGQKWINACWYYRPEQTVHQYEKHFFPDEVVKTGQYRDHKIEEVVDRCFVMFFTRFSRGRPRGFDVANKKVYVCEARYNEEKHKFNKIKTWASCLPDEVRDKDYEMDLWPVPQKIKKQPSPLLYLLKNDTNESNENASPQWGNKNAPPLVGAIHKQPRDENQSPPPEPTPPPPTPPPPPVRAPSANILPQQPSRPSMERHPSSHTIPPQVTPQAPHYSAASASPAPQYGRQPSYQQQTPTQSYANVAPQTPAQPQPTPYVAQQQLHPPPALSAAHPTTYTGATPSQNYARPPMQPAQPVAYPAYPNANAHDPREPEVYILSDSANASIPEEIRGRYPQDDQGRVLFFAHPPVDTRHFVTGHSSKEHGRQLEHTEAYLKAKEARQAKIRALKAKHVAHMEARAGTSDEDVRMEDGASQSSHEAGTDGWRNGVVNSTPEPKNQADFLQWFAKHIHDLTFKDYQRLYGDRAVELFKRDSHLRKQRLESEVTKEQTRMELQKRFNHQEQSVRWDQDFWTGKHLDGTGRFEDDFDNRLPK